MAAVCKTGFRVSEGAPVHLDCGDVWPLSKGRAHPTTATCSLDEERYPVGVHQGVVSLMCGFRERNGWCFAMTLEEFKESYGNHSKRGRRCS